MHIPDGYISPQTSGLMYILSAPFWAVALKKIKTSIPQSRMPLLAMLSAFSFLVMMFNVPLPGGTTGHATGAVLIAVLIGPWAAIIALTMTLAVQAFFFGDGGVLALGANSFNIAIIIPLIGYGVFKLVKGNSTPGTGRFALAAAVGAYAGINAAALATAFELGIQPALYHLPDGTPLYCPFKLAVTIPAMMIPHLTVGGLAEAVVTLAVVAYLGKHHAEMLAWSTPSPEKQEVQNEV